MSIVNFSKAVRSGSHLLIALLGESGSGKTFSSLLLGRGLIGANAVLGLIDTETGRGKIFADKVPGGYLYGELTPPFTPERYIQAVKDAEAAGVECLIIDSASHEWEGLGGLLEIADAQTSNSGGELKGLLKWSKPKQRHKKFMQTLLTTRMHIIFCLRAKEKLIQQGDKIVSAGFVAIQDKHFVYEMTVQLFLPNEGARGIPQVVKCPGDLLGAFPDKKQIGIQTGKALAQWVAEGAPVDHNLESVRRTAEDLANEGSEAFKKWWKDLGRDDRDRLKPFLANYESIALAADEEKPQKPVSFELLGDDEGPGTQVAISPDELRDDFLPVKRDALNKCKTPEEVSDLDTEVAPVLKSHQDILGIWNGYRIERLSAITRNKAAA